MLCTYNLPINVPAAGLREAVSPNKLPGPMPQECKLLEGPAAASAQILLATAAIGALVYKRSLPTIPFVQQ